MSREQTEYSVKGHVTLEGSTEKANAIRIVVKALVARRTLGTAPVNENGDFKLSFHRKGPLHSHVELVVGPTGPIGRFSRIRTKRVVIDPDQWKPTGSFSADRSIYREPFRVQRKALVRKTRVGLYSD